MGKVPRGRPLLGEAERYRERILEATTAVFLEKGFNGASTNEIARRAQTSKQTLYALFPTKADLFVGVMSAHMEQIFSSHMYYIESGKAPRRVLAELGCKVLNMFSAPEFLALHRIVVAEVYRFPDLARAVWHECVERGHILLAEILQTRRIGGPNYIKSAAQFLTFVLGDFFINAMLNPDLALTDRAVRKRVREAVEDFLRLHPLPRARKQERLNGPRG
jgi:AcrR family transcriptional regulator